MSKYRIYHIKALWFMLFATAFLLTACGDTTVTTAPTPTPRPTFVLETPTPTTIAIAAASPTVLPVPTRDPRTPTVAPTRTPTPNPRSTPTSTPNPSATPIQISPAPSATPRPNLAIGGDLVSARDREPSSLHPYGLAESVGQEYRALLYDAKLLKRNPNTLEWQPHAALAYKYDDPTLTISFMLRRDMRWSDTMPLTTDDFIWTYQMITEPGRGWPDLPRYSGKIKNYFAPDKYTLQVQLTERVSNPLEVANLVEPLPKHFWDGQPWADPERNTNINRPVATSGPWKLKEWGKDDRIIFTRNSMSAVSVPPYLNSLTFLRADNKKALEMLRNGDIDFYSPPAADYGQLSQMSRVVTYRWNPADASFNFLGFNFRRKLWQDLTVRKAINSAIERAYVIKNIAEGPAVPLYSDVPPGNPAYNEDVDKPIYSLNMAQNLLLERGYRLNGYRLNGPDGKELPEISLIYNIESDTRKVLAGYIAGQLEALGFKVKSTGLDFKTFTNRLQDPEGDYDLFLSGWKPTSPDIEQFKVVWQDAIGGYKNQQLLDLYNKASREPERQTRYEVLKQVQQFEAQNLPCIYLYANQEFSGIAGIIGGVSAGPLGIKHSLYTNWFIK